MSYLTTPAPLLESAHWQRFSSQGTPAHFYQANGFPLAAYQPLLSRLSERFALTALKNRATWPEVGEPGPGISWATYADDLITYLDQTACAPVIGIGHSMGAIATLIAAHRRPDLFRALVLIEPAMITPAQVWALRLLPMAVKRRIEPVRSTLRKTGHWPCMDSFVQHYQRKPTFRGFTQAGRQQFLPQLVVPAPQGGVMLGFPARWEAWNYANALNVLPRVNEVTRPTVVIRGRPSLYFSDNSAQRWQQRAPATLFLADPRYGHLLPMEAPAACFRLVEQGLMALNEPFAPSMAAPSVRPVDA